MCCALAYKDAGISFAGVHDSYWSHFADADVADRIVREQFLALHETPLLQDLYDQLVERNPKAHIAPPPPLGRLDISASLNSPYMFS